MQEWEWPGSAGGAQSAVFAGHLFTSRLVSKIKKTIPPPSAGTVLGNYKGLPPLFISKQSEQLGNQV